MFRPKHSLALGACALPLLLAGCSDAAGPDSSSRVAVRFGQSASSGVTPSIASLSAMGSSAGSNTPLVVSGSNGTLTITNVSFIVAEVELECQGDDDLRPACADFKAPPAFVRLPLGAGVVDVASAGVPSGSYTELEFEIEDLEDDLDDSATERAQYAALRSVIRAAYPDFPDKASMLVEGTFTPSGSTQSVAFRTYFDAEIEIEMGLTPPLVVSDAVASRALSVDVQPGMWFRRVDGTVVDLSRLDYGRTRSVVGLEVEVKQGFRAVKFDN